MRKLIKGKILNWLAKKELKALKDKIANIESILAMATTIGVDVHFKSPTMIIIFSTLHGGQIRYIDANIDNLKELNELVTQLKKRYNANRVIWDKPSYLRNMI